MGRLRWSDALLPPSLISLTRLPLAAAFIAAFDRPWPTLLVLAGAGLSDVLDGWWARRHGQVTPTGAVIDPIADKVFVAAVLLTLLDSDRLPLWGLFALAARDIGELPLVGWTLASRSRRKRRAERASANVAGKAVTVLQFVTIAALLLKAGVATHLLIATGIAGILAALLYARRELSDERGAVTT
jgi:CDP-diacylglycerol--glycerol-3-phosphate 3-phosphatidyltransferase/cardiolipin synthase